MCLLESPLLMLLAYAVVGAEREDEEAGGSDFHVFSIELSRRLAKLNKIIMASACVCEGEVVERYGQSLPQVWSVMVDPAVLRLLACLFLKTPRRGHNQALLTWVVKYSLSGSISAACLRRGTTVVVLDSI